MITTMARESFSSTIIPLCVGNFGLDDTIVGW
jgi:hypothetical protein